MRVPLLLNTQGHYGTAQWTNKREEVRLFVHDRKVADPEPGIATQQLASQCLNLFFIRWRLKSRTYQRGDLRKAGPTIGWHLAAMDVHKNVLFLRPVTESQNEDQRQPDSGEIGYMLLPRQWSPTHKRAETVKGLPVTIDASAFL